MAVRAGLPPTLVLLLILPLTANAAYQDVLKHPHHQRRTKSVLPNVLNQLPLVSDIQQQQQIPAQPLPIANPVVPPLQPIPPTTTPPLQQQPQQQPQPPPLPITNPVVPPLQPIPPTTTPVQQQQQALPSVVTAPLPRRHRARIHRTRTPRGGGGGGAAGSGVSLLASLSITLPLPVTKGIPGAIGGAVNLPSFTGGKGSYPSMAQEFVDAHNQVRAKEGEAPLAWDPEIARFAEEYLNTRRTDCAMKHSGNPIYGESLFKGSGWDWHAADAVNEWAKEVSNFDTNTNTCFPGTMCGHYTAIVWKPTTHVGCARMECYAGGTIISCNYYPAGGPLNPFQH